MIGSRVGWHHTRGGPSDCMLEQTPTRVAPFDSNLGLQGIFDGDETGHQAEMSRSAAHAGSRGRVVFAHPHGAVTGYRDAAPPVPVRLMRIFQISICRRRHRRRRRNIFPHIFTETLVGFFLLKSRPNSKLSAIKPSR